MGLLLGNIEIVSARQNGRVALVVEKLKLLLPRIRAHSQDVVFLQRHTFNIESIEIFRIPTNKKCASQCPLAYEYLTL